MLQIQAGTNHLRRVEKVNLDFVNNTRLIICCQLKMSKSTMIKDLRPVPTNQEVVLEAAEADVSVQEVLSEIEKDSIHEQTIQHQHNQMMSQPYVPNYTTNTEAISNQLLQQQLLQQQILQQQLMTQKDESKGKDTLIDKFKHILKRDNNLFMVSVILYLIFMYVDVLNILKIDDFNIFERYPFLINLVTSLIFGLTIVLIKPLM
jgi:hypothetical protein